VDKSDALIQRLAVVGSVALLAVLSVSPFRSAFAASGDSVAAGALVWQKPGEGGGCDNPDVRVSDLGKVGGDTAG
jgi:hypothetical protein